MIYLLLVIGLVILLAGGKLLVDGASALAAKLGLSAGLIGLTVVSFGTSAPELLVSVSAALKGNSDISLGNVIGSNITNISLVLGISAIVFPIAIHKSVLKLDYLFMLLSSLLFYILSFNGLISRIEGILFVILLVVLNWYFFRKLKGPAAELDEEETENLKKSPIWKAIALVLGGVLGLYFGADLFVDNAVEISKIFGISERVIGVTVIAIGTSLPELTTSIIAAINKKTDIAIGNILGSNIMNILAIIGITALVQPISVSEVFLKQDFIWMLALTLLLFPILRTKLRISRWEGMLLVMVYAVYIFTIL
ncbi:K+-dependent Na+/Ca+ exchanger [Rhodonellum psychrophilum GCM71 = DSM 17998]|uniref:K+-dependent Na+/Ca+ exchanger n=2 Tax=Rhodonellum TaxID=336827 RepID=U5C7F0_9BACT|nr:MULTISPECIES: calcium/sodium antiporter [Rhodonellum]ERM84866.1 K+-dependent Na+/Ca+ exchanger [Rhodonellum psychrophilum GCM71 = DSM 17998]SDY72210.1 cation:H+ antiporter [Rhodonellum ikkaensis]